VTDVDGLNAGFARDLFEEYLENPDAVPAEWRRLFVAVPKDKDRGAELRVFEVVP